ncbi:MAG: O-antigen ligase family protein [Capsulimonadales bacterium]|nr:O-antigen ligase family protein [Capsulimonadales bacterium]
MSVRPIASWEQVLRQPARPVPWYVWPLALGAAVLGGVLIADPKTAFLLAAGLGGLMAVRAILARPICGFLLALCLFPEYTFLRGVCELYHLPLPLTLVGMWPEVVLVLMGVSLIVTGIRTGVRLRLNRFDLPVVLLIASGLYGMVLSAIEGDARATMYGVHTTLTPLCFYLLARWLHQRPEDLPRILRYWLVGFCLLAIASIYDFLFRPDFVIRVAIVVREQFWGNFEPHTFFRWYPRMQSLLFAEQNWGTLCGLVGLFCMARIGQPALPDPRDRVGRRALWAVFLLALFGLIFSMSRGAHICWIVACVVLFGFRGGHRRILAIGLALGLLTLLVAFSFFGTAERVNWLVTRTTSLADSKSDLAYGRVSQWTRALSAFPLFPAGRGLGRVGGSAMYHGTGDGFDFVADGGYFKILGEQGLPGIILFLSGAGGLIVVLVTIARHQSAVGPPRTRIEADDRALTYTVLPFFCGLLVQNIGGNIFDAYFLGQLFWLLAGLVVGRYVQGGLSLVRADLHGKIGPARALPSGRASATDARTF